MREWSVGGVLPSRFSRPPPSEWYTTTQCSTEVSVHPNAALRSTPWKLRTRRPASTNLRRVHESDLTMSRELLDRGYTLAERTRAMGRSLEDLADTRHAVDLVASDLCEHLRIIGVPELHHGMDPSAFHVVVARLAKERVATAMAFDHAGDCGVFNVATLESARRQGIATAVTQLLLQDAAARGCATASPRRQRWQEGVYAAAGFTDLGRILEYVPPALDVGAA